MFLDELQGFMTNLRELHNHKKITYLVMFHNLFDDFGDLALQVEITSEF